MITPPRGVLPGEPTEEILFRIASTWTQWDEKLRFIEALFDASAIILRQFDYSDERKFRVHEIMIELYKNAADRPVRSADVPLAGQIICLSVFYAPDWVVVGCSDDGDFYSSLAVQTELEAHRPWPSPRRLQGGGIGLREITKYSSKIVVDLDTNTIWCQIYRVPPVSNVSQFAQRGGLQCATSHSF